MILRLRGPRLVGSYEVRGLTLDLSDGWVAIDTETTGLDPWGTRGVDREQEPARAFMTTLCDPDGACGMIRWPVDPITRRVVHTRNEALAGWLADERIAKVWFNANFDRRMFEMFGYEIRGEQHDVLLMVQSLDPDAYDKRLKPLAKKHCGIEIDDETALMESCQRIRRLVRSCKSKLKRNKILLGDELWYSRWSITEPKTAEWEERKQSDADSAKGDMFMADAEMTATYGMKDALRTASLYVACVAAMDKDAESGGKNWETYRIEQDLQPGIKAMEDRGVAIDKERTLEVANFYLNLMREHQTGMVTEAGADFNPGSWKDKQFEFFRNRGHKPIRYSEKKVKGGHAKQPACTWCKGCGCDICDNTGRSPKVDSELLEAIGVDKSGDEPRPKDKLAWHLLHWSAARAMLTFVSAYAKYWTVEDGQYILHPNYKQAGPVTGRLSAEKPNLQNVASDDSGKKKADIPYRPRECFIPRRDHILYVPDYSQIEVWILALRSGDQKLLEILLSGGDVHGKIAAWSFKEFDLSLAMSSLPKPAKDLTKEEDKNLHAYKRSRKKSKNLQFCKIYGGGLNKIAFMIGCSLNDAQKFIDQYEAAFPGVSDFMRRRVYEARKSGYIENGYGVRYPIDPDRAYVATNYDIQGTAAYLLKRAMTSMHALSQRPEYLGKMYPILTLHDELFIEVHESIHAQKTMRDVAWAMQSDHKLLGCPMPFPIGFKVATERWSESSEVKL